MRVDLDKIQPYVQTNSHVLDLGCGNGDLLVLLGEQKNVSGVGLENDPHHIAECIKKGVNVIEYDLNKGLAHIADNSYDQVIMTFALQAMERPDLVLEEMLRIGKQCIVTFPNFAHWKARYHLLVYGRMPVSDLLPYEWYNTPNIHFCTIKDFEVLCKEKAITILDSTVLSGSQTQTFCHNLLGETAIYHLSR